MTVIINRDNTPSVRIRTSSTPPKLPSWLRVMYRLDRDYTDKFRERTAASPFKDRSVIAGYYDWYQLVNNFLEENNLPERLVIQHRQAQQHYVKFTHEYDTYFAGAQKWGRKIFVRPGLMSETLRKYRTISGIFSHGEPATTLTKRIVRGANADTIGLEMEVVIRNCDSASSEASDLYNKGVLDIRAGRFVIPCYDGSLGDNGVEYKTGIFDLNFWNGKVAEEWRERFRAQRFKAYGMSECGLHINIGRNNTFKERKVCEMTQAFLFSPYWGHGRNPGMDEHVHTSLMRVAGRQYLHNSYCSGSNLNYSILGNMCEKYQPMRLGTDRVEFRIFQSTTLPERLHILPAVCIEIGKSVKRLESIWDHNTWDSTHVARVEWGRKVWGDIIQRSESEDVKNWLQKKLEDEWLNMFAKESLPATNQGVLLLEHVPEMTWVVAASDEIFRRSA